MRVTITNAPKRKKPQSGDEKVVKGVTYVRQHKRCPFHRAFVVSNGKPVWRWVVKGDS